MKRGKPKPCPCKVDGCSASGEKTGPQEEENGKEKRKVGLFVIWEIPPERTREQFGGRENSKTAG